MTSFEKAWEELSDLPLTNETREVLKKLFKQALTNEKKLDDQWMREWLNLWPTQAGISHMAGRPFDYSPRTSYPETKRRMIEFLKDIKDYYPDAAKMTRPELLDRIFAATERYLRDRSLANWEYTKKAIKFIKDGDGSMLAEKLNGQEQKHVKRYTV